MSIKRENICRLCLNVVTNGFSEIDEVMVQTFDILSLELDLNITREPIMCWDCVEIAEKCLKFKLTCFTTERVILSYSIGRANVKHNIKVIYREREKVEIDFDEDLHICRICMTRLERNKFASLDTFKTELTMFDILAQCMSEMDVNIIEEPVICTICTEKLNDYFKFVANCLDTERKITAFCKAVGNENNGQITLGNVLHFLFKQSLEHPEKYSQICAIKEERNMFEETKCGYPEAYNELIQCEVLDIKEEVNLQEDYYKDLLEMELDKSTKSDTSPKTRNVPRRCIYQKEIQATIMEDSSKNNMNSNTMHKCLLCAHETRDKSNLKKHMLVHKDVSETDMYKCSVCTYETKLKSNLKMHMLVHKDVSEVDMHKCSICAYETKHKRSLRNHLIVHKDVSEVDMHKCSICAFETKHKKNLRSHLLVHKDFSEVDMHKCSVCTYETKRKINLKTHMLVHQNISENSMHKCSICTFRTKRRKHLNSHMMIHQDISEIKMHKCFLCDHESKNKSNLRRHMLKHRDVSEIKMYKCSVCAQETKDKSSLKRHMLRHKDISELAMHKCSMCTYETKFKSSLKGHMLVHKDVSEIDMHKCSMCTYETRFKNNLKSHMLIHKDISEIDMHKCSLCTFQTKYKTSLKTHMAVHQNISKKKHRS